MALVWLAALAASFPAASQDAPPKGRELDTLVAEYVALDGKEDVGLRRQDEILRRLETVEPLDAKAVESWRKKINRQWAKGPKLRKKAGSHFLWNEGDEKRGLYVVGGDARTPRGLFIGLHDDGDDDAMSSYDSFSRAVERMDWVAIFPGVLERTESAWTEGGSEEFVIELVERARRTWKLDPNRVFFGGHGMGGNGTWTLGAHHADVVAGLTASAGAPTPVLQGDRVIDIEQGIIPNLLNVPMVIYQSDDDPRVPAEWNRKTFALLEKAREAHGGYEFEYWEEQGRGHTEPPGGMRALLEKIRARERNPLPDTVLWQPTLTWKRHFYWLWWDQPAQEAIVHAYVKTATRSIYVDTWADPKGLYVLLNDALLPLDGEVVVYFREEEVFRGVPQRSLAALVSTGARGDHGLTFEARIPVWK